MFSNKREIISFHISGLGGEIGNTFWSSLESEYSNGHKPETFFEQSKDGSFSPRAMFFSKNKINQRNQILCTKANSYFDPYKNNNELKEEIQEKLRKEVEKCSCLEGFIITRSMATYNASGLGSSLLETLYEYDKTAKIDFRVYPDHLNSSLSEEDALNSTLATYHAMAVDTDLSVCLDSGSLRGICSQNLDIKKPSFDDICRLSAYLLESLTIPMRHKGQINGGLKDMVNNLVPFPRLNCLIPAIAPIVCQSKFKNVKQDTISLTSSLFSSQNQFINCENSKDKLFKHLAGYISYQGDNFDLAEIDDSIEKLSEKLNFADFIPARFKVTSHRQAPQPTKKIFNNKNLILGLINSTMIANVLSNLNNKTKGFIEKKSFVSKYSENDSIVKESVDELGYMINEYEMYSKDQCYDDEDF